MGLFALAGLLSRCGLRGRRAGLRRGDGESGEGRGVREDGDEGGYPLRQAQGRPFGWLAEEAG